LTVTQPWSNKPRNLLWDKFVSSLTIESARPDCSVVTRAVLVIIAMALVIDSCPENPKTVRVKTSAVALFPVLGESL
jgi:hypothetical protein